MTVRYTPEELHHLRESPLVVKPPTLPPPEQWMGLPADPPARTTARTAKQDSNILAEQANRRPQHISRNSTNPEHIILGPPKTAFMSATSNRNSGKTFDSADRPPLREAENTKDRFAYRNKNSDGDDERAREGRNNLLRPKRAEGDQDSEGWSTVKPRKSFGTEGAERFNGRMGVDRNRDDKRDDNRRDDNRRRDDGREDRRFRDRDDRDVKDRPPRVFDRFNRDKDAEQEQSKESDRSGGLGRGNRGDSWFNRENRDNDTPTSARDRNSNGDKFVDRNRGWREKDPAERENDRGDRGENRRGERNDRNDRGDRRWGNREEKQERDPEWMDEPSNGKQEAHTQEDFQKWKDSMRETSGGTKKTSAVEEPAPKPDAGASFFGLEKLKVDTPLAIDTGPDKFFGMWAAPKEESTPSSALEPTIDGPKPKAAAGKSSRFTSFFTPTEEPQRRQTEPPPPPPAAAMGPSGQVEEQVAFQQLLKKLHSQSSGPPGPSPPVNPQQQPKPPAPENQRSDPIPHQDSFQQYRTERQEERQAPNSRNSQHALQDLLTQRNYAGSQSSVRPEQMLQELVGQRQNTLSQSSQRPDPGRSNSDFLMTLMRNMAPPPRTEETLLRQPPKAPPPPMDLRQQQLQQQMAMEQDLQRELVAARDRERMIAAQRQQVRSQPPPGFFDRMEDQGYQRPQHERQPQPTQILQRPPPGLDQMPQMPPNWAQSPGGLGQPQMRSQQIAPPPGLAGRGMPPPQMYGQGFMGNYPPPDARMQPPPGFYATPPGFMPPMGFQGQYGAPYDERGPPPQGAFRR